MLRAIQVNVSCHLLLDWQNLVVFWRGQWVRACLLQDPFQQKVQWGFQSLQWQKSFQLPDAPCGTSILVLCPALSEWWDLNGTSGNLQSSGCNHHLSSCEWASHTFFLSNAAIPYRISDVCSRFPVKDTGLWGLQPGCVAGPWCSKTAEYSLWGRGLNVLSIPLPSPKE